MEIEELSKLSTDDLLSLLGREMKANRLNLKNDNEKEIGKKLFMEYKEKFRHVICQNPQIENFLKSSDSYTRTQIAAGIFDCISGYLTGIALATVSVLIAKEGLTVYCRKT